MPFSLLLQLVGVLGEAPLDPVDAELVLDGSDGVHVDAEERSVGTPDQIGHQHEAVEAEDAPPGRVAKGLSLA